MKRFTKKGITGFHALYCCTTLKRSTIQIPQTLEFILIFLYGELRKAQLAVNKFRINSIHYSLIYPKEIGFDLFQAILNSGQTKSQFKEKIRIITKYITFLFHLSLNVNKKMLMRFEKLLILLTKDYFSIRFCFFLPLFLF